MKRPYESAAAAVAAVVMVLCALAGCAGSLLETKRSEPDVYLLSARIPADPSAVIPIDVSVQPPRVRAGLDNDRIALLHADRRVDYFAGARWSAPVGAQVQDLTIQALRSAAHLRSVTADDSAFLSRFWVEIEVLDFQAEYAAAGSPAAATPPAAHVHLLARIGGGGDRRALGSVEADAVRPAAADRLGAIIDAYEQAVDAALADVVAGTLRTLGSIDIAAVP